MTKPMVDIIIPVYNQLVPLNTVIYAFSLQNVDKDIFKLIIVDDGSSDELSSKSWTEYGKKYGLNGEIIHQPNKGRAAARNTGVSVSNSEVIIFCDADRFPKQDFIEQHLKSHHNGADIVVGASFDYFGKAGYVVDDHIDWNAVYRYSRLTSYFKKISSIYDEQGQTTSRLAWLSFLVGNSSIKRSIICEVGGFDESFVEWGFEHFELAYRLFCKGHRFMLNMEASNYHIPHPRTENFYSIAIAKNADLICKKHPEINKQILEDFVSGKIGIDLAEKSIYMEDYGDGQRKYHFPD